MFRELAIVAMVCTAWSSIAARAQCRSVCMPDEARDRAGCCAAIARESVPIDPTIGCGPGMLRSAQTQGECCWPGQAYGDGACRGIPTSCPTGYAARNEACELLPCASGRVRAPDQISCCWPGQIASAGQCRGVPTSCPANFDVVGEGCSDQRYREALAAQQQEQALAAQRAEAARLAALQAEQDRAAAAQAARDAELARANVIAEARDAAFFRGLEEFSFGVSFAASLPPIFESFLYLAPRATVAIGLDAFEMMYSVGWVFDPEGPLSAMDIHAQMGVSIVSFPRLDRSAMSYLNLSIGAFGDAWIGDGVPDEGTIFGGVYVAETMYLGCFFSARVQYSQTLFGMHGPISPSIDVSVLFGSRTADDPEGGC